MRFRIEQRFAATVDEVLSALTDPQYLEDVTGTLKDLGRPEIERCEVLGATVHLRLRHVFLGSLPSVVTKVVDPRKLSWTEDTVVDLDRRSGSFTMTPIHYPSFFTCKGTWTVTAASGLPPQSAPVALRTVEGTMKVSSPVPFVGGQVERAIVSGLTERLGQEPAAFAKWCAANPEHHERLRRR
jgi:hypothetical protein